MTARNQPRDRESGEPVGTGAKRTRRGGSTNRGNWPASGAVRDWLAHCDKVREDNGRPSLAKLAEYEELWLKSRTRINELLRGLELPVDEQQARALLAALGATDGEIRWGIRLYKAALVERDRARRGTGQPDWWLRSGYVGQVGDIAPLQLLGRQGELEELADWCAGGEEAYA
jgi:hypothetical protein